MARESGTQISFETGVFRGFCKHTQKLGLRKCADLIGGDSSLSFHYNLLALTSFFPQKTLVASQ